MELPIVAPAPVVTAHAEVFRDLVDNQCQFRPVQHSLTGLIVLPNKSLASIARCILASADQTTHARFLSEAPWREDEGNRRRIRFMRQQTQVHRRRRRESMVAIADPLGAPVGKLFDHVDRHYNHSDGPYPLAHHPVTSFSVTGPVRFPLGLRLYRRDEDLTQWEAAVTQHVPDRTIPRDTKGQNRLHQQVDPVLRQAPEFRARHEPFRTNIALAVELIEEAIRHKVPFGVVVFDAWYLAEDVVPVLTRRRKDWISRLQKNRLLETASFHLRDANGWALKLPVPHIAVEALIPLIPANAYRPVKIRAHTYGCFTLAVRLPGLGKVRIVVSLEQESLTGRSVVLVTNRVDWRAAKLIDLYSHRWPTDNLLSGQQGAVGLQRVSDAECRSHWETWVSGLRRRFAVAPDGSACRTRSHEGPHPHHGRCVSAAGARSDSAAVGLRP